MPRQMLSVANVMMKGCGRRPNTYTAPLTNPTARPVATMAAMTTARIRDFEQQPANHGREGKVRADRKIDAPSEDDEMLADRNDRDH